MFYISNIDGTRAQYTKVSRYLPTQSVQAIKPVRDEKGGQQLSDTVGDDEEENEDSPAARAAKKRNPYEKLQQQQKRRQPAVLASQIMSSPVLTLLSTDRLSSALTIFQEKRLRHLPIVSPEGKLVGILSDRDGYTAEKKDCEIGEVMSTDVITASPSAEIRQIAHVLVKERIGAMPVLDEKDELVGMVTRTDILRTVVNEVPLELWV